MPPAPSANFDPLARPYRWLEYLTFGPMLERCRFCRIPELAGARRALVLGDGDGRFLARLLAANPALQADVVDQSPAMLRLLQTRVATAGTSDRIRVHQADALTFQPSGAAYDLVITHFFLDCFTTEQVRGLVENLRPHLAPGALWIASEFAIPRGVAALPSRMVVSSLYLSFRILTGLRTRALPDHPAVLRENGLKLQNLRTFLAGLLVSERWINGEPVSTRETPD
ncbi:MAG: class I SAM-dependent methyltransferase [Acidobacteriaceae bacterium]